MTSREHAHQLIDEMTDEQVKAAEHYLAAVKEDPVLNALLNAETDDEPLTPHELASIRASEEDIKHGRVVSLDEAEQRLLNR